MSEKKVVSLIHRSRFIKRSKLKDDDVLGIMSAADQRRKMREEIRKMDGRIEEMSREIKRMREKRMRMKIEIDRDLTNKAMADRLGVAKSTVDKVTNGQSWSHVEPAGMWWKGE